MPDSFTLVWARAYTSNNFLAATVACSLFSAKNTSPFAAAVATQIEARKLEHGHPPTTKPTKEGEAKISSSFCVHVPACWLLLSSKQAVALLPLEIVCETWVRGWSKKLEITGGPSRRQWYRTAFAVPRGS